jgi:hypothetical protein
MHNITIFFAHFSNTLDGSWKLRFLITKQLRKRRKLSKRKTLYFLEVFFPEEFRDKYLKKNSMIISYKKKKGTNNEFNQHDRVMSILATTSSYLLYQPWNFKSSRAVERQYSKQRIFWKFVRGNQHSTETSWRKLLFSFS